MAILIEALRKNIRLLDPDGPNGFEGLMAAVLSDLTACSFALASSGSQHGRDGQSAMDGGAILFEAKRYDDAINKEKIFSKILEVAADKASATELYIVGATCPISAQHINTLQNGTEQLSIALLILAWPATGLPELATILAMTPDVSSKFIAEHTSISAIDISNQLAAVRVHPQFSATSEEILTILRQPSIAPAFALKNNIKWLSEAFSDGKRAKRVFGQALSPDDTSISGTIDRKDLRTKLANVVFSRPDDAVTAILGAEGNGKSWIFAQTWARQSNQPLTLVIVPDDLDIVPSPENCLDLLIAKLITQTDELKKEKIRLRWLRHFERWKLTADPIVPRLVVFIDGVNQRESVNWPRLIDAMSAVLIELGGRLVFSCRRVFYRDNLENKLASRVISVDVPEWTDSELEAHLNAHGTSIAVLDRNTARSLHNPRIFGIAASLFTAHEISEFGELSVSRLLFEHMRGESAVVGAPIQARQFVADICTHAESIVERIKDQVSDGFNEFEMPTIVTAGRAKQTISEQFVITSAGHFFEVLDENPNKYVLKDDGLPLALGLALVRTVRQAIRKKKNIDEALFKILDPIAALDKTGDILLGAIISSVLEKSPKEVVAPLVRSFVMLQNLDAARYREFRSFFGRDPDAFLEAFEQAILSSDIASNLSWITDAMEDLRGNSAFENSLVFVIRRWLNMYSLAPGRMAPANTGLSPEEYEKKLTESKEKLDIKVASLSQAEKDILATMVQEVRGDYSELSLVAFRAMARRPISPFSEGLRNWCFASSLNGGYYDHRDDFNAALHFNLVDWAATKNALRIAANAFRFEDVSRTGQWALVSVLRATGDSDDALEAEQIAEELTKDREHFEGWRRVERYCSTDPCDPESVAPDNIDKTAIDYAALDVATLRRHTGLTVEDLFYIDAQPGLARFRHKVAITVLRAMTDQVVTREQSDFRTAIYMLEDHTVGLESRVAESYVEKSREIAQAALDSGVDKHNEGWVAAQYALCLAFAHMSGDAQFDALINHPRDRTLFMDLCYLFQPIDEVKLEHALKTAIDEDRPVILLRILAFAEHSGTPLTIRTKELVAGLIDATDEHVRLSALSLMRAKADPFLLSELVKSDWSAGSLDPVSRKIEIFHGSQALVRAAEQGMITIEACLDRIVLSAYENLAHALGTDAVRIIGARFNTAIQKAIDYRVTGNLPDIEQNLEGPYWPVMFEVSERISDEESQQDLLLRLSERGDAWYERQKRNNSAAQRFEHELTKSGAQLITQAVTAELIGNIDEILPTLVDSWCTLFMNINAGALKNIYNVASVVAEVVSKRNAVVGLNLFEKLRDSSPHVRVTLGLNKIVLNAATVWCAADSKEIIELRYFRLDSANNDHDLAMEVLAAISADRVNALEDYVVNRRQRPEPAHRARAVMLAGLSPCESWAVETVEMFKHERGFLGEAYQAAKYAMERHRWARYWAAQMRTATDPQDLWRYSVLLSKIVDGRFNGLEVRGSEPSQLIKRFGTSLNGPIRNRIQKWKSKRDSKLFGMKIPHKVFLPTF